MQLITVKRLFFVIKAEHYSFWPNWSDWLKPLACHCCTSKLWLSKLCHYHIIHCMMFYCMSLTVTCWAILSLAPDRHASCGVRAPGSRCLHQPVHVPRRNQFWLHERSHGLWHLQTSSHQLWWVRITGWQVYWQADIINQYWLITEIFVSAHMLVDMQKRQHSSCNILKMWFPLKSCSSLHSWQ